MKVVLATLFIALAFVACTKKEEAPPVVAPVTEAPVTAPVAPAPDANTAPAAPQTEPAPTGK